MFGTVVGMWPIDEKTAETGPRIGLIDATAAAGPIASRIGTTERRMSPIGERTAAIVARTSGIVGKIGAIGEPAGRSWEEGS